MTNCAHGHPEPPSKIRSDREAGKAKTESLPRRRTIRAIENDEIPRKQNRGPRRRQSSRRTPRTYPAKRPQGRAAQQKADQ